MRKKRYIIILLSALILALPFMYWPAYAYPVKPEHRSCQHDSECVVIEIGCGCCNSGDINFKNDAVNTLYKQEYNKLQICTQEQKFRCSVSNCVTVKEPAAKCNAGTCVVEMVPVR